MDASGKGISGEKLVGGFREVALNLRADSQNLTWATLDTYSMAGATGQIFSIYQSGSENVARLSAIDVSKTPAEARMLNSESSPGAGVRKSLT